MLGFTRVALSVEFCEYFVYSLLRFSFFPYSRETCEYLVSSQIFEKFIYLHVRSPCSSRIGRIFVEFKSCSSSFPLGSSVSLMLVHLFVVFGRNPWHLPGFSTRKKVMQGPKWRWVHWGSRKLTLVYRWCICSVFSTTNSYGSWTVRLRSLFARLCEDPEFSSGRVLRSTTVWVPRWT